MKILGFAGLAQAGKSTAAAAAAAYLLDKGLTPVMERFAGPLKDASDILGFKKGGDTQDLYREFCQFAGKKAREAHPDWWVRLLKQRVNDVLDAEYRDLEGAPVWHERVIIIDDVRFQNEIDLIHEFGGKIVFLSAWAGLTDLDAEWRQHESEDIARKYEAGELEDELFDFTVKSTIGEVESLKRIIGPLSYGLVTHAEEYLR